MNDTGGFGVYRLDEVKANPEKHIDFDRVKNNEILQIRETGIKKILSLAAKLQKNPFNDVTIYKSEEEI